MDQRSTTISRKNSELPLFFDRCFDKNRIKTFIGWLLANFGENATVYIVEKLKNLGFYFATEAGISLSIDDLQVPSNKNWFLSQAERDIKKNHNNFQCGNLTPVEQSQQLLDRWHRTSEILRESVIQSFRLTNTLNPVYMMAFSGARGNISQVRQLVGMRGLMADPQGQIISFPIRSNFREGLTLTEYVISCYGARKGVVDTALRTADSGYLTRRLVDVSQHVVVWTFDCKTDAGIHLTEMKEGKKVILPLKKRILGRVLAQEVPTIAFRNQQISAQLAQQIASLREHVLVRSPLSCSVPNSVCQLCYGWSLSRGRIVSLGEAVGVIAAQSIGEPGTQLTMRTFHTGGVFSGDVIDEIRAPHDGSVRFLQPLLGQLIRTSHGKIAYLTRANGSFVIENNLTERKRISGHFMEQFEQVDHFTKEQNVPHTVINLEPGTALFVRQGEKVIAKQLLAEYSSISAQTKERVEAQHQVYSDQKGEIFFDDVLLGKKLKKEEPEIEKGSVSKFSRRENQDSRSESNLQNQFKQNESEIFVTPEKLRSPFSQSENGPVRSELRTGSHSVEQNTATVGIQKVDQQNGRKVDIVTSLKLNTLWILSGTLFEPPVFSTLYTKIGDLVDKTTLLTLIQNELNLQTPHLDGEYILSTQLKKKKITKRKEKLLTFFRKNLVSSKLPRILQKRNLEDDMKKRESLFLNKFSLNLIITNIKYKKSGYFFANCQEEKGYNFYSLLFQAENANLFQNFVNLKNYKKKSKVSNWTFIFDKAETNFLSTPDKGGVFLQTANACENGFSHPSQKIENSCIVTEKEQELFLRKEMKNMFVLAKTKQLLTFPLKPNKGISFFQKGTDLLRLVAADKVTKAEFFLEKPKNEANSFFNSLSENSCFARENSRIFMPKYSKESAKAKDLWFRTKTNLVILNEKIRVQKKKKSFLTENLGFASHSVEQNVQRLGKNKKNVNHFFTTTSLNQPFSNCREFKNEFVLQWFSPVFKTETGGLIYTNNHYCNKRSTETQIFFIAEGNYGKKDLGKMNFRTRKKSFNIVSFKELITPSICLTNVFLNGKKKPSSSFKSSFISFSGDFASILSINKSVKDKYKTKVPSFSAYSDTTRATSDRTSHLLAKHKSESGDINIDKYASETSIDFDVLTATPDRLRTGKTYFGKKQPKSGKVETNFVRNNRAVSINSLLSEINFLQNKSLNKELFFLRKKENFSYYSSSFNSTKPELFNTTINLLKKGSLSFKNKWIQTDIPLGYQKNLQGSQIPFYSIENGVLKNNLAPSFFTNQYSSYWVRKKNKKFLSSLLKNFSPLIFKYPLPHIKVKKKDFYTKKTFLIDSLYLNRNKFFGENDVLIKNFNRKPISEKLYQKEFWWANQQTKTSRRASFFESKVSDGKMHFPKETWFSGENAFSQRNEDLKTFSKSGLNSPAIAVNQPLSPLTGARGVETKSSLHFAEQNVQKPLFLHSKEKMRFSLTVLLTKSYLNLAKKKVLKFNPFPSKGNYSSSAFVFRINMKGISFGDIRKESSLFYNPYPYSQPLFIEFLQNKLTANFHYLTKKLKTDLDLQDKYIILQGKTLFPKPSFLASQIQNRSDLTKIKNGLQNESKADVFVSHSTQPNPQKQKQENSLKNLKIFEDYKFPQNLISCNNSKNKEEENQKFNKFSCFLQKQINKISTKKHKKKSENLQRSNLKIRPGWLYLPKDQSQTAKAHQSFIAPFQQNIDEIIFDQFPVYIESILRKNFEEQLSDKYLRSSTDVVDFCKTRTLVEKSQLQKFINQISTVSGARSSKFLLSLRETFWRGSTFSSFVENDFITSYNNNKDILAFGEAESQLPQSPELEEENTLDQTRGSHFLTNHLPTNFLNHTKISSTSSFLSFLLRNKKERKTKYLQEKNIFSHVGINVGVDLFSKTENKKARTPDQFQSGAKMHFHKQNPLSQKESIENKVHLNTKQTPADMSFSGNLTLQGENKELKLKDFPCFALSSEANITKKEKENDKFLFLRPVSINPIKIVFQVVTNKSCRFNSIQSFALSCVNNTNFDFSQDSYLQSQIIDKKLPAKAINLSDTCIKNKVNPGFFLCLPQISRVFFVKNKPFSDFILVSRKLNFDQVKIKSHIFSDKNPISSKSQNQVFVGETHKETSKSNRSDTFDQIKSEEQNLVESFTLSEKNKSLICRGRQLLVLINKGSKILDFGEAETKESNKCKNLDKFLQSKTFLIENLSTEVDTNYFSFLLLIPNSSKTAFSSENAFSHPSQKSTDIRTNSSEHSVGQNVKQVKNAFLSETPNTPDTGFQKKKLGFAPSNEASFSHFFSGKSKLWLLIRKVAEYPLLDTSIFQQKTRLYKGNQTFFEKELIYSSTPLSLYMSNRILFSSKFNKQKKKETYWSFYHSPKVSLKIKENTFYLLNTFSKLEKQHFANLSIDLTKNGLFEDKLKLPFDLFSCQKIFWQIFDLHRQNVQKKKFFEGKQPLFANKIFDTEKKDLLKDNVSDAKMRLRKPKSLLDRRSIVAEPPLLSKVTVQNKTWFFQKENLENVLLPQEKEQTIIRSFKQSYLLHFFLNFTISKQSPLQRIEIKTTFEKIEGSTQTSSCAHYFTLQKTHTNAKNDFFINCRNLKIDDLNLQNKKTEYLQKNDGQQRFSAFSWLNTNQTDSVEQDFLFFSKKRFLAEKLKMFLRKTLNDNIYHKIEKDLLPQSSLFTKQSFLRNERFDKVKMLCQGRQGFEKPLFYEPLTRDKNKATPDAFYRRSQDQSFKEGLRQERQTVFDKPLTRGVELKFSQEKSKFWKYSFTPFARDLSFTLSFTAKLNQSWFFSLANNVKNKTGVNAKIDFRKQSSTFQSNEFVKEDFISASKTQLIEKKRKQEYFKNKKSISKQSSSYSLKEKSSHTTLLLDQNITTYDKTPVAITAIMSKEEGEIKTLKNNSACLILKNSDIEILLTKKENPLVIVGQLVRYGEQIANGIAAPKSGQIIQVDTDRVTLRKAQPILFPRGGSVDVNHGDYVKEGSPLLSLSYQRLVTGDIVQGIPKIEQLFEARETEGGQPLLSSLHSELEAIFLSYSTQLGLKLAVRESFKEIQQIIVDRVQRVYIAQGVLIADKHFEVVIRQMTSKVRILDGGRPGFLYGELVDLRRVELLNAGVPFTNEQAIYEPIILGISKACLEAEGFLSPASFQETTRVLSLAAIERKTDFLRGIKERVILGDVIQAGTGFTLYDRPVRKIKQEECIDLSLSVLHNAHSILSTNQYYKQL